MKTKLIIVPLAAALTFAMLPSCTGGNIDPEAIKTLAGIGERYLDHREKQDELKYDLILDRRKAKEQPVDSAEPELDMEDPAPASFDPTVTTTPVSTIPDDGFAIEDH